ncbi:MAG: tetratricopeptide repeat protein [Phreatobacter sp.]
MIVDRYQGAHTADQAAVARFEIAVRAVAAHRPEAATALAEALSADPDMIAAHALRGFSAVMLARHSHAVSAAEALARARAAAALRGGTSGEKALVEALGHAVRGGYGAAAARLEAHLDDSPRDLLAFKLSHALRFMGGDRTGMLAASTRLEPCWSAATPGFGFFLGCHAFGIEETGDYATAERLGRRAVEIEPDDAWGIHAVSHVHEMSGRLGDGVAWLESCRATWSGCSNFAFHVAWHLGLFHLEAGRLEAALDLYDREIRPTASEEFRDTANAVSFLWRLRQEGVDGGDRWRELADIARRHRRDTTLVFASLHYLLALLAAGDLSSARDVVLALGSRAGGMGDQSRAAAAVGADLAQVLLGLGGGAKADLSNLVRNLTGIGGSNAQRDVFLRSLALIAADRGDSQAVRMILGARQRLQRDDRFARLTAAHLETALGAASPELCVA